MGKSGYSIAAPSGQFRILQGDPRNGDTEVVADFRKEDKARTAIKRMLDGVMVFGLYNDRGRDLLGQNPY